MDKMHLSLLNFVTQNLLVLQNGYCHTRRLYRHLEHHDTKISGFKNPQLFQVFVIRSFMMVLANAQLFQVFGIRSFMMVLATWG